MCVGVYIKIGTYTYVMYDFLQVSVVVEHSGELWAISACFFFKLVIDNGTSECIKIFIWYKILNAKYSILQFKISNNTLKRNSDKNNINNNNNNKYIDSIKKPL
jgi:hypothetical protein